MLWAAREMLPLSCMDVMGAGIYANSAHKALMNNSLIKADSYQRLGEFSCLSGSKQGGVGHFIGRDGKDITYKYSDPFHVSIGGIQNPGFIQVSSANTLYATYQGIYTCRIPDETANLVDINVGLYRYEFNTAPRVTLERNISSSFTTLTCTSTGSPPTTVTWTKDGVTLPANETIYSFTQTLVDRATSTYNNTLTIDASFVDVIGNYSCSVSNSIGTSSVQETEIKAVEIHGHDKPILVGLVGEIYCSTYLNITQIEWFLVGVDLPKEKAYTQNVTLTIRGIIGLNGDIFKCRVTDVEGQQYEESVTIIVKELQNIVTIHAAQSTMFAGSSYTLNCTVMSDLRSVVKWTGLDGNPVETNTSSITVNAPVYNGNKTYVFLRFPALRTSQAGRYTCQSVVSSPLSVRTATKDVVVTVPSPRVHITRTPFTDVYPSTRLNLTCITELNSEVDTPVTVTHSWRGPSGSISRYSSRPTVSSVTRAGQVYWSSIFFSSGMRASDSGTYYCTSSTSSSSSSSYIVTSGSVVASTSVSVALKVVIDISYTPPEEGYQPPYYRAASPVTLTCRAVGTIDQIRYRWTSTCSSCFVPGGYYYSYGSNSRSQSFLVSRDAGTHTCSAYDSSQGISGSASTVMKIVGAGIYVRYRYLSYSSTSLPNNSIISSYTGYSRWSSYRRIEFYCCSNSTSGYTGTFIELNGNSYSGRIRVEHFSSSHSYAGCMYIYLYSSSAQGTSEQGIYTCRMPDSAGRNIIDVNVGIYRQDYTTAPHVTSLQSTRSTTNLALTCTSTNSPATNVTWMKDGDTLDIDGVKYKTYQTVTDRRASTYQNTLVVDDDIENITGNYTCKVTNRFGNSSSDLTIRGIHIHSIKTPLIVGDTVSIVCSTNLAVTMIEWIRDGITVDTVAMDNSSNHSLTLVLDPVSADHHNTQYTCRVTGPYGVQEETVNITVQLPQAWATVEISTPPDDSAIVGREFVMTCTVTVVRGLTVVPRVVWTGPDGNLTDVENITMGYKQTSGLVIHHSLTLHSLQSSEGGQYSCIAAINIPKLEKSSQKSAYKHLNVISQALIQLKFGPLQHCVQWTIPNSSVANWIDHAVKKALIAAIRERCSCNFQSTSIKNGEFSCQTTTTHVVYRTMINGTSDLRTAPQLLNFIEDWIKTEGAFSVGYFRLWVVPKCPLQIQSFYQLECMNDESTSKQNLTVISRKVP